MKKILKTMITVFNVFLLTLLMGCPGNQPEPVSLGSVSSYSAGQIIKNKVVLLNDSTEEYYEYLEFTSSEGGNYSLYQKVNNEYVKLTQYNNSTLPSTFTYDATTGKLCSYNQDSELAYSYIFSTSSNAAIAKELLKSSNDSINGEWSFADSSDANNYLNITFDSENKTYSYSGKKDGNEFVTDSDSYTYENGWISLNNSTLKLYMISNTLFYYNVYTTERTSVEQVGRTIDNNTMISFELPVFILVK